MPTNHKYDLVAQNPHSTVVAEYVAEYGVRKKRAEHYQSEAELEQAFIEQLKSQAYEYLPITSEDSLKQNVRKQAVDIIQKVLFDWSPGRILIGTGNHDRPHPIKNISLPVCWENLK